MVLLGESLAPSLGAYASEMRTRAMHEDVAVADGQSTWLREGDRIVSLRRQAGDFGYGGGVLLFELGPEHALNEGRARRLGRSRRGQQWVLSNYAETSFATTAIRARTERESREAYGLNPELLELSVVREDLLDTPALQRYIGYLAGQRPRRASLSDRVLVADRERRVRGGHDGARAAVRVRRPALGRCGSAALGRPRHRPELLRGRRGAGERRRGLRARSAGHRVGAERGVDRSSRRSRSLRVR